MPNLFYTESLILYYECIANLSLLNNAKKLCGTRNNVKLLEKQDVGSSFSILRIQINEIKYFRAFTSSHIHFTKPLNTLRLSINASKHAADEHMPRRASQYTIESLHHAL
jgi:hypothetical protein